MIWESYYWKKELQRIANSLLHRCSKQKRWPESSFAKMEQEVMLGCFITRKLIDSFKISTSLAKSQVNITSYPFIGSKRPDHLDWHHLERFYDLKKHKKASLPLVKLCNQMIHSYIFMPSLNDDNHLKSLFVSSDYDKSSLLFEIEANILADIFMDISSDCPANFTAKRKNNGEWKIKLK